VDPLYALALSVKAGHRELDRRISDLMRPLGVTAPQADALYVIGKAQPLSLKELGELLIAEAGHPSRLVDRLVAAGWVERAPSDEDRRRLVLALTPAGKRLLKKIQARREEFFEFARPLMKDVDVDATLHLFRELLQYSDYKDLLEKRKALETGPPQGGQPDPPGS
jgi:MarR family transcriptional regulator, organic hydroperoxide resistance regulator